MDEDEVAAALLERHGDQVAAAGEPTWLAVRWTAGGDVEESPLCQPEGWLGQRLPPGWEAAAVVATGRIRSLDAGCELPAGLVAAASGGLRLCAAVSRRRRVGWRMRLADGTAPLECPTDGFILDVLRRAVGHPTPPPASGPAELVTILWLQVAATSPVDGHRRLGWAELIGMHPLLEGLEPADPDGAETLLARVATTGSWEHIRLATVEAEPVGGPFPTPELAAWMDEGIFARWVLSGFPPLARVMQAARGRVTADAYHRLRRVLPPSAGAGVSVPERPPPDYLGGRGPKGQAHQG